MSNEYNVALPWDQLRFIEMCVRNYPDYDKKTTDQKTLILNNLASATTRGISPIRDTMVREAKRLEKDENIQIAVLDENQIPVFKFIKCPKTLELEKVFPKVSVYRWHTLYYHDISGAVGISESTAANTFNITLNKYEIEALIAFALYHNLRKRGVPYSGLDIREEEETEEKQQA